MRRRVISMCLGLSVWCFLPNAEVPGQARGATADWLVWGGPTRDFRSPATGLAASWPAAGPPRVWTRPLGEGFSAAAVEGNRLYTTYSPRPGHESVAALDAGTGKTVWEYDYETTVNQGGKEVGFGPYAMPQVIGDRVVTVGGTGRLHSLDKRTGKPVWSHDLLAELGGDPMTYGYSCHALPYKNLLILLVGGKRQAIAAFDQADGRLVWGKHAFANAHSSPLLIDVDGQPQVVALMRTQIVAFDPATGDLLWEHPHPSTYLGVSTPIWGADNVLVVSSAYGGGTRALHLTQAKGRTTVRELWHSGRIQVHFGSMIRIGGIVYAASGESGPAPITAFEAGTGRVLWHSRREFAKSQLLLADNKLIILDEDGVLALATPAATGLTIHSRVQLLNKVAWTPPSLAGKTLYIRDRTNLMALDLGAR